MKWKSRLIAARQKINLVSYPVQRAWNYRTKRAIKVKLVAIAKNEAAYIPEWVSHHLYFGFDSIEIHYNGCTDNTAELQHLFPVSSVKLICADDVFENPKKGPQTVVYKNALKASRRQGFTHVFFLDLDEFWLPLDFETSIKKMIEETQAFDLLSFPWRNKINESLFERAIVKDTQVEVSQQVKTLYSSYLKPSTMNPHNTVDSGLIRLFEDGKPFPVFDKVYAQVPKGLVPQQALIVHRKFRSEREYVAMLSRGRPINLARVRSQFKNNRNGFEEKKAKEVIAAPDRAFELYDCYMKRELGKEAVISALLIARECVEKRFQKVVEDIENAPLEEADTLKKILRRVSLPAVLQAYISFKSRHNLN